MLVSSVRRCMRTGRGVLGHIQVDALMIGLDDTMGVCAVGLGPDSAPAEEKV
jgi:hypothetical protein